MARIPFSPRRTPDLSYLDNVDPVLTDLALDSMNPKKTHVVVIAKSGSTAETIATFLIVQDWLTAKLGKKAAQRISVVTSEGRGDLKKLATQEKYRTFHLPENVGGRFSVLSAVGLLPAALIDIDIRKLAKGAAAMTNSSWQPNLQQNIALRAGSAALPDLDQAQQVDSRGIPLFESTLGDGVLVPAVVGGVTRESQES